jgi:hypothetical protein
MLQKPQCSFVGPEGWLCIASCSITIRRKLGKCLLCSRGLLQLRVASRFTNSLAMQSCAECINYTAHCVAYCKADLLPLLVLLCCCFCAECQPPHFAAGVQAPAAAGMAFTWDQCLDATTSLAMFGERCGPNLNKFRWARQ